MAGKPRYKVPQIIEAINATKGMVYLAAQRLGCSHQTLYNYARRHPTVQQAIDANRGELLDAGELKLREAVLDGQSWAVQFLLRTLGRNRGYVERREQQVSGPEGGPIEHRITGGVRIFEYGEGSESGT